MGPKPWSLNAQGVMLTMRLAPKSARDAIEGIETLADGTTVLRVRVRAAPSKGEANAAAVRLLARTLRLPARDIVLITGLNGRLKRLLISGDGPKLIPALERLSKTG